MLIKIVILFLLFFVTEAFNYDRIRKKEKKILLVEKKEDRYSLQTLTDIKRD